MKTLTPLVFMFGLCAFGCAATPRIGSNIHPDDLSASGHRSEAAAHAQEARLDRQEGHGSARADTVTESRAEDDAIAQESEARTHLTDAAILERAVQTECARFEPSQRSYCGFGERPILSVEDIPSGVRIRFAPGGPDADDTLSRMRCTHAQADFVGRQSMPQCVVAIRDLTISARNDAGPVLVTLTTAHQPSVAELRRRAHALMRIRTETSLTTMR